MFQKCSAFLVKYRYAALILAIGLALMLIPGPSSDPATEPTSAPPISEQTDAEILEALLTSIKGAGRVEVLLSYAAGERIIYQTDTDDGFQRSDTVTVTDSERNQSGLVVQKLPAEYLGAVIVCQGAGNPSVRLAIVDAVSKFTGLGAHEISVLEMK